MRDMGKRPRNKGENVKLHLIESGNYVKLAGCLSAICFF